jgi:hypothetical protein
LIYALLIKEEKMTLDLNKEINMSDYIPEGSGSRCPNAADKENVVEDLTISLTHGYRYQWIVLFPEQNSAPTTYPHKSVAYKKATGIKVAL